MRVILGLTLLVAACGQAAPQAEDQSTIRADGRAIDGDTVSFDVRLSVRTPSRNGNYAATRMAAGRAERPRRIMPRSSLSPGPAPSG